jgi:hypothetical protein
MHSEPFEHPHVGEGLYGHETVTILTLLSGMTEAESARLDFPCHLTRELGKSVFGNEDIVLMQALLSVSRSM